MTFLNGVWLETFLSPLLSVVTGRVVQFELILELIRNFFKNSVLLQTFVIPKLLRCLFLHSLEHFDEGRSVSQF